MAFVVGNDHLLAVEALQHFTVHETDALHGANTVISATVTLVCSSVVPDPTHLIFTKL